MAFACCCSVVVFPCSLSRSSGSSALFPLLSLPLAVRALLTVWLLFASRRRVPAPLLWRYPVSAVPASDWGRTPPGRVRRPFAFLSSQRLLALSAFPFASPGCPPLCGSGLPPRATTAPHNPPPPGCFPWVTPRCGCAPRPPPPPQPGDHAAPWRYVWALTGTLTAGVEFVCTTAAGLGLLGAVWLHGGLGRAPSVRPRLLPAVPRHALRRCSAAASAPAPASAAACAPARQPRSASPRAPLFLVPGDGLRSSHARLMRLPRLGAPSARVFFRRSVRASAPRPSAICAFLLVRRPSARLFPALWPSPFAFPARSTRLLWWCSLFFFFLLYPVGSSPLTLSVAGDPCFRRPCGPSCSPCLSNFCRAAYLGLCSPVARCWSTVAPGSLPPASGLPPGAGRCRPARLFPAEVLAGPAVGSLERSPGVVCAAAALRIACTFVRPSALAARVSRGDSFPRLVPPRGPAGRHAGAARSHYGRAGACPRPPQPPPAAWSAGSRPAAVHPWPAPLPLWCVRP